MCNRSANSCHVKTRGSVLLFFEAWHTIQETRTSGRQHSRAHLHILVPECVASSPSHDYCGCGCGCPCHRDDGSVLSSLGLGALLATGLIVVGCNSGGWGAATEPADDKLEVETVEELEARALAADQDGQTNDSAVSGRLRARRSSGATQAPPRGRFSYVVVGAGTTANAAIESILQMQPHADILQLSDEIVSSLACQVL